MSAASGNFNLRGGPLSLPDHTWTPFASTDFFTKISNEPLAGFPPSLSTSDMLFAKFLVASLEAKSSRTSLNIVWALFLNTDQEVQCKMLMTAPSALLVVGSFLGFLAGGGGVSSGTVS